ncbi:hypothetical protein NFJ02_40g105520 [Pycnococcus provasolii]
MFMNMAPSSLSLRGGIRGTLLFLRWSILSLLLVVFLQLPIHVAHASASCSSITHVGKTSYSQQQESAGVTADLRAALQAAASTSSSTSTTTSTVASKHICIHIHAASINLNDDHKGTLAVFLKNNTQLELKCALQRQTCKIVAPRYERVMSVALTQNARLLVTNVAFVNGAPTFYGGGAVRITAQPGGANARVVFHSCTFEKNQVGKSGIPAAGGAVELATTGANVAFSRCHFKQNYASRGGSAAAATKTTSVWETTATALHLNPTFAFDTCSFDDDTESKSTTQVHMAAGTAGKAHACAPTVSGAGIFATLPVNVPMPSSWDALHVTAPDVSGDAWPRRVPKHDDTKAGVALAKAIRTRNATLASDETALRAALADPYTPVVAITSPNIELANGPIVVRRAVTVTCFVFDPSKCALTPETLDQPNAGCCKISVKSSAAVARLLEVQGADAAATFVGVAFAAHGVGGMPGGAAYVTENARAHFVRCVFYQPEGAGGGAPPLTSRAQVVAATRDYRLLPSRGGGIAVDHRAVAEVESSLMVGLSAVKGGAAAASNGALLILRRTELSLNGAAEEGGAVSVADTAAVDADACVFALNAAAKMMQGTGQLSPNVIGSRPARFDAGSGGAISTIGAGMADIASIVAAPATSPLTTPTPMRWMDSQSWLDFVRSLRPSAFNAAQMLDTSASAITHSVLLSNAAYGEDSGQGGGALAISTKANAHMISDQCTFRANSASRRGGAIALDFWASLAGFRSGAKADSFPENAEGMGDIRHFPLHAVNGTSLPTDDLPAALCIACVARENRARHGGFAAASPLATLTLVGGSVKQSTAEHDGGAVYVSAGGNFAVYAGEFRENTASGGDGGAVYLAPAARTTGDIARVQFIATSFANNTGRAGGGQNGTETRVQYIMNPDASVTPADWPSSRPPATTLGGLAFHDLEFDTRRAATRTGKGMADMGTCSMGSDPAGKVGLGVSVVFGAPSHVALARCVPDEWENSDSLTSGNGDGGGAAAATALLDRVSTRILRSCAITSQQDALLPPPPRHRPPPPPLQPPPPLWSPSSPSDDSASPVPSPGFDNISSSIPSPPTRPPPRMVEVSNRADLVVALANPSIREVVLTDDIACESTGKRCLYIDVATNGVSSGRVLELRGNCASGGAQRRCTVDGMLETPLLRLRATGGGMVDATFVNLAFVRGKLTSNAPGLGGGGGATLLMAQGNTTLSVFFRDCDFIDNHVDVGSDTRYGGAVYVPPPEGKMSVVRLSFVRVAFHGNLAMHGGAVALGKHGHAPTFPRTGLGIVARFQDCDFDNKLRLSTSTCSRDVCVSEGNGIIFEDYSNATLGLSFGEIARPPHPPTPPPFPRPPPPVPPPPQPPAPPTLPPALPPSPPKTWFGVPPPPVRIFPARSGIPAGVAVLSGRVGTFTTIEGDDPRFRGSHGRVHIRGDLPRIANSATQALEGNAQSWDAGYAAGWGIASPYKCDVASTSAKVDTVPQRDDVFLGSLGQEDTTLGVLSLCACVYRAVCKCSAEAREYSPGDDAWLGTGRLATGVPLRRLGTLPTSGTGAGNSEHLDAPCMQRSSNGDARAIACPGGARTYVFILPPAPEGVVATLRLAGAHPLATSCGWMEATNSTVDDARAAVSKCASGHSVLRMRTVASSEVERALRTHETALQDKDGFPVDADGPADRNGILVVNLRPPVGVSFVSFRVAPAAWHVQTEWEIVNLILHRPADAAALLGLVDDPKPTDARNQMPLLPAPMSGSVALAAATADDEFAHLAQAPKPSRAVQLPTGAQNISMHFNFALSSVDGARNIRLAASAVGARTAVSIAQCNARDARVSCSVSMPSLVFEQIAETYVVLDALICANDGSEGLSTMFAPVANATTYRYRMVVVVPKLAVAAPLPPLSSGDGTFMVPPGSAENYTTIAVTTNAFDATPTPGGLDAARPPPRASPLNSTETGPSPPPVPTAPAITLGAKVVDAGASSPEQNAMPLEHIAAAGLSLGAAFLLLMLGIRLMLSLRKNGRAEPLKQTHALLTPSPTPVVPVPVLQPSTPPPKMIRVDDDDVAFEAMKVAALYVGHDSICNTPRSMLGPPPSGTPRPPSYDPPAPSPPRLYEGVPQFGKGREDGSDEDEESSSYSSSATTPRGRSPPLLVWPEATADDSRFHMPFVPATRSNSERMDGATEVAGQAAIERSRTFPIAAVHPESFGVGVPNEELRGEPASTRSAASLAWPTEEGPAPSLDSARDALGHASPLRMSAVSYHSAHASPRSDRSNALTLMTDRDDVILSSALSRGPATHSSPRVRRI